MKLNTPNVVVEKKAKSTVIERDCDYYDIALKKGKQRTIFHEPNELKVTTLFSFVLIEKIK